jgi:hypothetical protein
MGCKRSRLQEMLKTWLCARMQEDSIEVDVAVNGERCDNERLVTSLIEKGMDGYFC